MKYLWRPLHDLKLKYRDSRKYATWLYQDFQETVLFYTMEEGFFFQSSLATMPQ